MGPFGDLMKMGEAAKQVAAANHKELVGVATETRDLLKKILQALRGEEEAAPAAAPKEVTR